jgi:TRAP-type C4-dicarboxylate transport system permease small subunit
MRLSSALAQSARRGKRLACRVRRPPSHCFDTPLQVNSEHAQSQTCSHSRRGAGPVIERLFEKLSRAIELALALGFVFAVCLNFANVVGRYALEHSILGADDVQIHIMVYMAFLGAVVVYWRRQHLRMDVLVQFFPAWLRTGLQALELALIALLAGFVLVQSSGYVWQMYALDRKSDNAGIPMWIPHGAVALGFGLMALIALWRGVRFKDEPRWADPAQKLREAKKA